MQKPTSFRDWFWHRPLFTHLRPRLMAMILSLVLPLSLLCIAISIVLALQARQLSYTIGQNGLIMVADKVMLQSQIDNIDLNEDFPHAFADQFTSLLPVVSPNGGNLYVSRDGREAFELLDEGGDTAPAGDFEALLQSKNKYLWQQEGGELRVLVTFPYSFALRSLPVWFWIAQALALITLAACPFLYNRLRRDILDPMQTLSEATRAFGQDTGYRIPPQPKRVSEDFTALFDGFNAMASEVQASHEKDVKLLQTEMDNLRLQVNPHMLLNSFNTIYALAESKNTAVIQDYALCLVDYFRYVLRRGQQLVTVAQELEFVENFIHIQRIRFPGRFSYVYTADDDCREALIPPLLIENFVENAIKYALNPRQAIEIIVTVRREKGKGGRDALHIAITDTGSGIRPEVLEKLQAHEPYIDEGGHKHIGIYNCLRRIELFYGEEGDIHFSSGAGMGTQIYMMVPFLSGQPGGGESEVKS